jgi:hypothetical protein
VESFLGQQGDAEGQWYGSRWHLTKREREVRYFHLLHSGEQCGTIVALIIVKLALNGSVEAWSARAAAQQDANEPGGASGVTDRSSRAGRRPVFSLCGRSKGRLAPHERPRRLGGDRRLVIHGVAGGGNARRTESSARIPPLRLHYSRLYDGELARLGGAAYCILVDPVV